MVKMDSGAKALKKSNAKNVNLSDFKNAKYCLILHFKKGEREVILQSVLLTIKNIYNIYNYQNKNIDKMDIFIFFPIIIII